MNLFNIIEGKDEKKKEYSFHITFNLNKEIKRSLHKYKKIFFEKDRKSIPKEFDKKIIKNTLDLLDADLKMFCSYENNFITNVDEFIIRKYEEVDKEFIVLNEGLRKDHLIRKDEIEETMNKWILENLDTTVLYILLGLSKNKGERI